MSWTKANIRVFSWKPSPARLGSVILSPKLSRSHVQTFNPFFKGLISHIFAWFFFSDLLSFSQVFFQMGYNIQMSNRHWHLHNLMQSPVHLRVCTLHTLSCIFICCVSLNLPCFVFLTFELIAYFKSVKTVGFWWCLCSEGNDGPLTRYVHILIPGTGKCYII